MLSARHPTGEVRAGPLRRGRPSPARAGARQTRRSRPPLRRRGNRVARRDDNGRVGLHVRDSGGVPHDFLARAFDRLTRAVSAPGGGGSGLGLALAGESLSRTAVSPTSQTAILGARTRGCRCHAVGSGERPERRHARRPGLRADEYRRTGRARAAWVEVRRRAQGDGPPELPLPRTGTDPPLGPQGERGEETTMVTASARPHNWPCE
jgi:hypothetical protein